jgi:hypothetical protein
MTRFVPALAGFLLGAAIFGGGWFLDSQYAARRSTPQIPFDQKGWKQGDASIRGRMYRDVVRMLQEQRPTDKQTQELLGPPGNTDKAYLNAANVYLVYHIDLGQRIAGRPFLDKLGIAFHGDGSYSHVTVWD